MEKPEITEKWKWLKKDRIIIGILVGILLLVISLPQDMGTKEEENSMSGVRQAETVSVEEQLEQRFVRVLRAVEGVGEVRVMITLKSSGKKIVDKDTSVSEEQTGEGESGNSVKRTEESTVFARSSQGEEMPFVLEETAPQVEGVLVAAQGGGDLSVAEAISDAAQVLFGVEAHKIKIMKLS